MNARAWSAVVSLELPIGIGHADVKTRGRHTYLRSIVHVAAQVHCRPRYLSDTALRLGYSYSRALRWLRFFHALALRDVDVQTLTGLRSLGFRDYSGWSRFTKSLVGKSPSQIPNAPMEFWVRIATEDVYLNGRTRYGEARRGQQDMRDGK